MNEKVSKLKEVLGMCVSGEISIDETLSVILDMISDMLPQEKIEEQASKKEEKIEEIKQQEEEQKEQEEKEEVMYSSNIIEAMILPKNEIEDIDLQAIKNYFNIQKPAGYKIPMKFEHLSDAKSQVIDIIEKEDGYYAKIYLEDDIKDYPYLSMGIEVIKENEENIPFIKEISFTSNPKKSVKEIEKIPEKVYSSLPKFIRMLVYSHPDRKNIVKKLNMLPVKKEIKEETPKIIFTEEEIRKGLRMI